MTTYTTSIAVLCVVLAALAAFLLLHNRAAIGRRRARIVINNRKTIDAKPGVSLLSALYENGVFLQSDCGGRGVCGRCRVKTESTCGHITASETAHLGPQERKDNVRLACQVKIADDISIQIQDQALSAKKYSATVVSNRNLTPFIKELILKPDNEEGISFMPGQYMQFEIPGDETCLTGQYLASKHGRSGEEPALSKQCTEVEEPVFRSYSFANPPHEKLLRFIVRIAIPAYGAVDTSPGAGSSFLFGLKQGDRVNMTGPYGDFIIKETGREICLVGGGAGMAPLRSHVLHQLEALKIQRQITFWYGARTVDEIFYEDEFRRLEGKHDNFSFHVVVSQQKGSGGSRYLNGMVHERLYDNYLATHGQPERIEYYLCGPPAMIEAAANMLKRLGVKDEMIKYDRFS